MKRTEIKKLYQEISYMQANAAVKVSGWVKTIRDSKTLGFIELNDGSFFKSVQVVFEEDKVDNFKEIASQNVGASLTVEGILIKTPDAKQPFEIHARNILVEGESNETFPLQKKRHSPEYLRTIAHLRPRTNLFRAAFRVRSEAAFAIHSFFHLRGYVYAHTPIITGSDCEGAGEMFRVTTLDMDKTPMKDGSVDYSKDFFGKATNLTVSGQLEAEAMSMAFGNVYTFGPTFRAENSNTGRHAAEFWMVEPEMAFCELPEMMDVAEDMLKFVFTHILESCREEMDFFNTFVEKGVKDRLINIITSEFGRITYKEAIDLLMPHKDKFENDLFFGCDLATEHERYLAEEIFKRPVFVTNYPKEIKSFYMKLDEGEQTVSATDCLCPGIGEIIGGSQREERLDVLERRMAECGLDTKDYEWYLDSRRFGTVKHSGFGLGFERLVMYVTGINNIRDVIPFPRTPGVAEY
ncbi:MAG: asparagine--tRNA ligase [Clostridia bacterium]